MIGTLVTILAPSFERARQAANVMGHDFKSARVIIAIEQLDGAAQGMSVISLEAGPLEDKALQMGLHVYRFDDSPIRQYLGSRRKVSA